MSQRQLPDYQQDTEAGAVALNEVDKPIDIVCRGDYRLKRGGDTVQLEAYVDAINSLSGWKRARLVPDLGEATDLRQDAFVIASNVDRPYELLELVHSKRLGQGQYAVCTIHHPLASVRQMRRSERGCNPRGLLAFLPESLRELAVYLVRRQKVGKSETRRGGMQLRSLGQAVLRSALLRRRVRECLDGSKFLLTLSQSEEEALRSDFAASLSNSVRVPNGMDLGGREVEAGSSSWRDRSETILCVGRIEPRKRQLEVAQFCDKNDVKISFVGDIGNNSAGYGRAFQDLVLSSSSLEWLGALPRPQVLSAMAGSKVLLNASWVEVQSLVDVEAATSGCYVVCPEDSATIEYFPSSAYTYAGHSIPEAVRLAVNLSTSERGPESGHYPFTWMDAAGRIVTAVGHK